MYPLFPVIYYPVGLNHFADMSWEEFKATHLLSTPQVGQGQVKVRSRSQPELDKTCDFFDIVDDSYFFTMSFLEGTEFLRLLIL